MLDEIGLVMNEWLETVDAMGMRAETEKMFRHNVESYGLAVC